jgi:acyl-CoA synthetase (NDP forming)
MSYATALGTLLASDEVDAVLMTGFFGGYASTEDGMGGGAQGTGERKAGEEIARLIAVQANPVAVQSMYPQSPSCAPIAGSGTAVFGAIEDAAAALAAVTGVTPPPGFAPLPPAGSPIADVGYYRSRRLLADAGVEFPAAVEVSMGAEGTAADAIRSAAAAAGTGPYVLKAMNLLHKSDAGGVAVGLKDADELLEAHAAMHARLSAPTYSVEAMADLSDGLELIVGVQVDPRFGPVAMVGLGGVYTEVLRDVAFGLAPLTVERAEELLLSLRTAKLLTGVRGRRAVDVKAAAAAIARITEVAAAHPEIAEMEVNPLFVSPSGALALDARCVLIEVPEFH